MAVQMLMGLKKSLLIWVGFIRLRYGPVNGFCENISVKEWQFYT
jgi:hypothetical protein